MFNGRNYWLVHLISPTSHWFYHFGPWDFNIREFSNCSQESRLFRVSWRFKPFTFRSGTVMWRWRRTSYRTPGLEKRHRRGTGGTGGRGGLHRPSTGKGHRGHRKVSRQGHPTRPRVKTSVSTPQTSNCHLPASLVTWLGRPLQVAMWAEMRVPIRVGGTKVENPWEYHRATIGCTTHIR